MVLALVYRVYVSRETRFIKEVSFEQSQDDEEV